ncbi:acyl-CoA reductase-like NAD-dependent aldehyde dehydrogenase [Trinickia symbiotica]|uniref:Betaine-aldehyde dehydrogenase n=1 Tax=Trinickia symbiotica TaxID=863227 RepID=A0A2N7X4X5_9BURK|nr:aldehyde dehydrogenase family protein [Trinickia symbiotica]PMS36818.1 betaine-aldehyde dehydrogenase [Trinickia symbiotica]PPK46271.1 acyl-CoA reductase-like NAD-dependent aldehyde dehydrogenase [Trinickia symbiotica]
MPLENILPEAKDGHHVFYDGRFQEIIGSGRLPVRSPASNEVIAYMAIAEVDDVAKATRAAAAAQEGWATLDALDRARLLRSLAELIRRRIKALASWESAITGRPLREMQAQMSRIPEWIEYFAGIAPGLEGESNRLRGGFASTTSWQPYGVCALLTPWNHPVLILVKKMAAALAVGNTVVIKPSELAPCTALVLAAWCTEAGIPPGVVNVATGEGATGAALCAAPEVRRIDLTGGTATGRRVAAAAAERLVPCTLELGGKTPVVVFEDSDIEEAAAGAVFAAFIAAGQTCVSASRFLVQRSIYEKFIAAFAQRVRALRIGDPADLGTDVGPVISQTSFRQSQRFIALAKAEGARLVIGGEPLLLDAPLNAGNFVAPTIFADVSPSMELFREEVFGPVVAVTPFEDEADALRLANDSPYALGASIWTRDVSRANRVAGKIKAGMIWINDHHKNDPRSIWGGYGDSGYGYENGWDALKSYLIKRNVIVSTNTRFDDWFAGGGRYG